MVESGRSMVATRPVINAFVKYCFELASDRTGISTLFGVRRQSVYWWIKEWKVERLVDALKLSRASGIPIEKLAGGWLRSPPSPNNPADQQPINFHRIQLFGDSRAGTTKPLLSPT
jgi:hypothetical protein